MVNFGGESVCVESVTPACRGYEYRNNFCQFAPSCEANQIMVVRNRDMFCTDKLADATHVELARTTAQEALTVAFAVFILFFSGLALSQIIFN